MKRLKLKIHQYSILLILILSGVTYNALSQTMPLGDSTTNKLLKVNFHSYIGKELYTFLLNDTIRTYYDEWDFMDYNKKYSLSGLYLNKNLTEEIEIGIEVFIDKYQYIEKVNFRENWDFNLLVKETVTGIRILLFRKQSKPTILKIAGKVPDDY